MSQVAEIALDTFKELAWDIVVRQALAKLLSLPLLGWWPLSEFITWIVLRYSEELYTLIKKFINTSLIVFRNQKFQDAYAQASIRLKRTALSHGIESLEFRKARDEDKKALSDIVRFDSARGMSAS